MLSCIESFNAFEWNWYQHQHHSLYCSDLTSIFVMTATILSDGCSFLHVYKINFQLLTHGKKLSVLEKVSHLPYTL